MKKKLSNVLAGIAYFDTVMACVTTYKGMTDAALMFSMGALCLIFASHAFDEVPTDGDGQ